MSEKAYPDKKATDRVREDCPRCAGIGNVMFGNVQHTDVTTGAAVAGTCFDCHGVGYKMVLVSTIRARETAARKLAEKAQRLITEAEARYATWKSDNMDLFNMVEFLAGRGDSFAQDVQGRPLSEKQAAVIMAHADRAHKDDAEKATAQPVPAGRGQVSGTILSAKAVESQFGTDWKILVKDDRGFKVYGNMPNDMSDTIYGRWYNRIESTEGDSTRNYGPWCWLDDAKGLQVSFTATLTVSNDDPKFGFFSRATKSTVKEN